MGSEQSAEAESRPGDLNASGRCLTSRTGVAGGTDSPVKDPQCALTLRKRGLLP